MSWTMFEESLLNKATTAPDSLPKKLTNSWSNNHGSNKHKPKLDLDKNDLWRSWQDIWRSLNILKNQGQDLWTSWQELWRSTRILKHLRCLRILGTFWPGVFTYDCQTINPCFNSKSLSLALYLVLIVHLCLCLIDGKDWRQLLIY